MSLSRCTRQDRCGLLPLLHTAGGHRRCRAGNITALLSASLSWPRPGNTHPASASTPMTDSAARVPAIVCHYAAYLYARAHVRPGISVDKNRAELSLGVGEKVLVAVFGCRKKNWSLRSVEIRCDEQTTVFTRGDLAKAVALLLGHEPQAPVPLAINGVSEPRTDAALRERRTTVIRV